VTRWTLVLPVKGGPLAKSRLGARPEVATAIALDCLQAVLACSDVARALVVTSDPSMRAAARALGAHVVPEARPGAGLVPAIAGGVRVAALACAERTAVLLPDLPALRPADLTQALAAVDARLSRSHGPSSGSVPGMVAVPDAEGSGTVLLAARTPADLDPAFGPDSLAEHVRRGAVRLDLDLPRLRRDVDTPADLDEAIALGVGPRTATAVRDRTA
jgi:2-phospho-L-lactate/phosphoenolpyruvate guanylyltransferase